jgi:hypothetical protein
MDAKLQTRLDRDGHTRYRGEVRIVHGKCSQPEGFDNGTHGSDSRLLQVTRPTKSSSSLNLSFAASWMAIANSSELILYNNKVIYPFLPRHIHPT